jgi:hypothetical protein
MVGWVLLGGSKWYRVFQDKYLEPMYFVKDGNKVWVTKYHPYYMKKSDHKQQKPKRDKTKRDINKLPEI